MQSNELLEKFTNVFLDNKSKILTDLEPILIDWSKGKDLIFKFEGLVEAARKKEQGIGDKKAAELNKELHSMKRKYETIRTEKGKTDKRCDSLVKEIDVLRFIEEELIKERKISTELHAANAELKSTSDSRRLKLNALEIELAQFKQTVASLTEELRTTKDSCIN
jgi:chromosome segregation ATPase